MRRALAAGALLAAALGSAGVVAAQQTRPVERVQRALELPAHRGLMARIADETTTLAPFTTDGCSGGLSTSWTVVADLFPGFAEAHQERPPWEACCVDHDRLYHDAGAARTPDASYEARLAADEALRACVVAGGEARIAELSERYDVTQDHVRMAYRTIGDAMFNAVRFGGGPCTVLPWRWGYGYPACLPTLP